VSLRHVTTSWGQAVHPTWWSSLTRLQIGSFCVGVVWQTQSIMVNTKEDCHARMVPSVKLRLAIFEIWCEIFQLFRSLVLFSVQKVFYIGEGSIKLQASEKVEKFRRSINVALVTSVLSWWSCIRWKKILTNWFQIKIKFLQKTTTTTESHDRIN